MGIIGTALKALPNPPHHLLEIRQLQQHPRPLCFSKGVLQTLVLHLVGEAMRLRCLGLWLLLVCCRCTLLKSHLNVENFGRGSAGFR